MPIEEQKINEISRKLGSILLEKGIVILQSAFKSLKPVSFSFGDLKTYFLNAGINTPLNQFDYKYFSVDRETFEILLDLVVLDKAMYLAEQRDCDNFASLLTSLFGFLFGLNTFGIGYGEIWGKSTGKFIALHYFNLFATKDGKIYLFDSLNPAESVLIEKGKDIVVNNWKYIIKSATFF